MDTKPDVDAAAVLDSLTVEDVERRLRELDGETRAFRTILRALRARERSRKPQGGPMASDPTTIGKTGHAVLLVNIPQLATLLGVSPATLHRLRSAGKLGVRPMRVGGSLRWRLATVERYIAESERIGRLLTLDEWDAFDLEAGE